MKGQSGHDMEDYHVAEYRKKRDHVLGLFAIYDGHLGDRVPTYLKDNLFDNILREVCSVSLYAHFHFRIKMATIAYHFIEHFRKVKSFQDHEVLWFWTCVN